MVLRVAIAHTIRTHSAIRRARALLNVPRAPLNFRMLFFCGIVYSMRDNGYRLRLERAGWHCVIRRGRRPFNRVGRRAANLTVLNMTTGCSAVKCPLVPFEAATLLLLTQRQNARIGFSYGSTASRASSSSVCSFFFSRTAYSFIRTESILYPLIF